jgi:hypothetical protein
MTKDKANDGPFGYFRYDIRLDAWVQSRDSNRGVAFYTTPPQQEAKVEPVAWRDAAMRLGEELSSVGPDGYYDMDAKEWLDWAMEQNPRGKHSLPQRTWVGLTDEEKIIMSRYDLEYAALIGEVERKLKELNT